MLKEVPKVDLTEEARDLLLEIIKQNYTELIVFGFQGSDIFVHTTGLVSKLKVMGALEAAKQEVWIGSSLEEE